MIFYDKCSEGEDGRSSDAELLEGPEISSDSAAFSFFKVAIIGVEGNGFAVVVGKVNR